jgi:hypothetical protein
MTAIFRRKGGLAVILFMLSALATPSVAQAPPPPSFSPAQLDNLVNRIALYPDSLLAQVLASSTFPDQIPAAARWADRHHYLTGKDLAMAIEADELQWDPSVQALLPFPSVLEMMAAASTWTEQLGDAFLAQQPDVMAAVQRQRELAFSYGYLGTNAQVVVTSEPYIVIAPVHPGLIVVPAYDPLIVFAPPRPGFVVGSSISFGFGVTIGTFFEPWGWGPSHIAWTNHVVYIDHARWDRTWFNRTTYIHPYAHLPQSVGVHRATSNVFARPDSRSAPVISVPVERHVEQERSAEEREAARQGHPAPAEIHRPPRRGRAPVSRDEDKRDRNDR